MPFFIVRGDTGGNLNPSRKLQAGSSFNYRVDITPYDTNQLAEEAARSADNAWPNQRQRLEQLIASDILERADIIPPPLPESPQPYRIVEAESFTEVAHVLPGVIKSRGVVEATMVWSESHNTLRLFPIPPYESWKIDQCATGISILAAIDENERRTGEIAGLEIKDFKEFDAWDLLPPLLGDTFKVADWEPMTLSDLLRRKQQEIRA